jgi:four helix bundle protein
MELEELRIYQASMRLADRIWEQIDSWSFFAKDTVGKQWVRAADSIAANISEGYGRYHYRENRNFLFYARGSLLETRTWLKKANSRDLVANDFYREIENDLMNLLPQLNSYIRSIGPKPGEVKEPDPEYGSFPEERDSDDS